MTELTLTKKKLKKRNSGHERGLPLKRRFVREKLEAKEKHGGKQMGNTRTEQEINELKATLALPRGARIARLEEAIEDLDREAAITGTGDEEMRLSGARLLNEEAMRLTDRADDDYGDTVREVVGNTTVSREEDDEARGSIHLMDTSEYEAEMREAVERRMKDYPEDYRD